MTVARALRPRWRWVAAIAVALLLVLVAYRPTPDSVSGSLPWNLGDPALNTWILAWESHAAWNEPSRFLDGNILHPSDRTLLASELMLPLVPVFGVVYGLTGNAIAAHNVVILGLSLLSLATTYVLARRLTGRSDVAAVTAIAFTFSGYVFVHVGHLQLLTIGFIPLAFLALFVALERQRVRDGVLLGLATFAVTTACLYYGALWMPCLATVVLIDLVRRRFRPGHAWWRTLAVAAGVALVLVGPVALAYARYQADTDFRRPLLPELGLKLKDLFTPAPDSVLYDGLQDWGTRGRTDIAEHGAFLGFVTLALAVLGLVVLLRRAGERRVELAALVAAGAVSLVLAVGPSVFGVPMPFRLLHAVVPGYDGIKAVSRFVVVALLALAVLAALGLDALVRPLSTVGRRVAVALVAALVFAELAAAPVRADVDRSDAATAVYDLLRDQPDGAVADLPIHTFGGGAIVQFVEGPRMLWSLGDWRPRVNGFSGVIPPGYFERAQVLNTFPSEEALALLAELDVRYVILHEGDDEWSYARAELDRRLAALPAGARAERAGNAWLVALTR